jgi:toxin-antitoxin system PIN domain toxin
MLLDANILLFAVDARSPFHARAATWLTEQLNGPRRVGLPWLSLVAFVRISTNPRAAARALPPAEAWRHVEDWLACDNAWIPAPTDRHSQILGGLVSKYELRGNLVTDGHVAALAIEHGLTVCSADTDFARFTEISWLDPVSAHS